LAQFEIELKSTGETATKRASAAVDYEIVRQENGVAQTIAATSLTVLRPGDLIIVKSN
ncbi:MAG: hypothetical protein JSS20_17175, partial [Proteobacteria bacterium]|nr:hypothetical protein [Pseudomonadota bacterium]